MKKVIWGALLIVAAIASGCKTGTAQGTAGAPATALSVAQAIDKAVANGALPKLDNGASLTGPDIDGNGVRDDIDAYINGLPYADVQKAALRQDAKANTAILTADVTSDASLMAASNLSARSVHCLRSLFHSDAHNLSQNIEKYSFNTKARFDAYMKFSAAMGGKAVEIPSGNTCD